MLDCGTQALDGNINDFYNRLIASGVAAQFEKGNPRYLSGMSGGELAYAVIVNTGGRQRGISYELGERTPGSGQDGLLHIFSGPQDIRLKGFGTAVWMSERLCLCIRNITKLICQSLWTRLSGL